MTVASVRSGRTRGTGSGTGTGDATAGGREPGRAGRDGDDGRGGMILTGLMKSLGGRRIVDGIDLDVAPGELVCLLGPSGCGKTTTLRMIAGFLAPDEGTIRMAGADVTDRGPDRRPSAMVFQNYALWPHMTVTQNVAFPLKVRKLPREEVRRRVDAALGSVGLRHHASSRPGVISGGEQQRVALARAIVQEPDVLLLDEPLSNLDAQLRVGVRDEIRTLQQQLGITTVLVTHDQDEALSIADRIAVMHDGRIEQIGSPAEVYRSPATRFTAGFIGTTSPVRGRFLAAVAEDVPRGAEELLVRPEDIRLDRAGGDGMQATVVRSVLRGHFSEAVIEADGDEMHAFVTGPAPRAGDRVDVRIARVMAFRDGRLVVPPVPAPAVASTGTGS